jgi:hypothetical protein
MIKLPIDQNSSWFKFVTELDGASYGFEFRWNERDGAWYCTLRDGEDNALVSGRKVVLGPMFWRFHATVGVLPLGDIYVTDSSGTNLDPGYADLGRRVVLSYASDAEILALL